MATGNTNYSALITSTLQDHGREIFDSISTNNALFYLLKQAGNIKVRPGGRSFTHPLIYGTNPSFAMISKMGTISLATTDLETRAEFDIKIAAGSISLSTIELAMNAGDKSKLLDLAEMKRMEAEISMGELLGDQIFADGSETNDFGGLQFLINETPASQTNVGGINCTANSYWQNYSYDTAVTAFNTSNAGLIAMNTCLNQATYGRMGPKVVITTKAIHQLYELSQTPNIRYARADLADAGFRALQYTTMPVLFDDNCPSGNMYFIDTETLWLQVLAQANMEVTQFQLQTDQLASSALMYFAGNLTTGSRRTQAVIDSITA